MSTHTYMFSELRPYRGIELFLAGEAEMTYRWYPAEPDVGIMSGGVEYDIHKIKLHSSDPKKYPDMELKPDSDLYKAIEDALTDPDYMPYICEDIEESQRPLY
jgi:hypothetical protein